MTNASRRIVLALLSLGVAAMFASSLLWRMEDHPLVRQTSWELSEKESVVEKESSPVASKGEPELPQGQAIMTLMQQMRDNPHDVEVLLRLASIFSEQGDMAGAKDMAQRAIVAAPSDHRPPYMMGVLLSREGKWSEAAEQLERSITLKDDSSSRYSLAVIYRYHLKQEEKARENYEKAASICEDPALASMIKAEIGK